MTTEQEIREAFTQLNVPLAEPAAFGKPEWYANSQYGYTLSDHNTKEQAEAATIAYYSKRMELIRQ